MYCSSFSIRSLYPRGSWILDPLDSGYTHVSCLLRLQWQHGWTLSHRTLRFAHGIQLTDFLPEGMSAYTGNAKCFGHENRVFLTLTGPLSVAQMLW
jgi:hypothetical protein